MDGLKPDARTLVQSCERCRPSKEDVEAFLGGGGAAEVERHGQAASSGSKTKAPGSAAALPGDTYSYNPITPSLIGQCVPPNSQQPGHASTMCLGACWTRACPTVTTSEPLAP
jgi:hypothetical protein